MLKVLTFDVGRCGGMAFKDDVSEETVSFDFISLGDYYARVTQAIELYRPDVVGAAYPTRHYNVIVYHSKLLSIIELACETKGVEFTEVQDRQAKKVIIGNGNAKKDEIMAALDLTNEHQADALMFARHIFKLIRDGEDRETQPADA